MRGWACARLRPSHLATLAWATVLVFASALPAPALSKAPSALRSGRPSPAAAAPRRPWSPPLAVTVGTASVLWGYDTAIIAGALLSIVPQYGLDKRPGLQGLIASAATVGGLAGSASAGRIADAFGRRAALLTGAVLFLTGSLLGARSRSLWEVVGGRLCSGVAIGISAVAVPIYAAECAPAASRGRHLTVPQFAAAAGFSLAYARCIAALLAGEDHHAMLGSTAPAAAALIATLLASAESPRWLLQRGHRTRARDALLALRGGDEARAARELQEIAVRPPRPRALPLPSRTNWTSLVPPLVLTGHASSLPRTNWTRRANRAPHTPPARTPGPPRPPRHVTCGAARRRTPWGPGRSSSAARGATARTHVPAARPSSPAPRFVHRRGPRADERVRLGRRTTALRLEHAVRAMQSLVAAAPCPPLPQTSPSRRALASYDARHPSLARNAAPSPR